MALFALIKVSNSITNSTRSILVSLTEFLKENVYPFLLIKFQGELSKIKRKGRLKVGLSNQKKENCFSIL